jgi:hypothetical protein
VCKNEKTESLYFRCAKKNFYNSFVDGWSDYLGKNGLDDIDVNIEDDPCNFYMEYVLDKQLRFDAQKKFNDRQQILKELFKKSKWLQYVDINDDNYPYPCVGGCYRTTKSIKLSYMNAKRNLCFDCFITKNDDLAQKYKKNMNLY